MALKKSELYSSLWSSCDELRGGMDASQFGATINQITNKSLNSFVVPMPRDDSEHEAIADVLTDMEMELDALEVKLAKARKVRQDIMQELLTGRIRLT